MENNCNGFRLLFPAAYIQGYREALQDVLITIDEIQTDLKMHKVRQSYKTYRQIVECMLDGRKILREYPNAFVRCKQTGGFEIYHED